MLEGAACSLRSPHPCRPCPQRWEGLSGQSVSQCRGRGRAGPALPGLRGGSRPQRAPFTSSSTFPAAPGPWVRPAGGCLPPRPHRHSGLWPGWVSRTLLGSAAFSEERRGLCAGPRRPWGSSRSPSHLRGPHRPRHSSNNNRGAARARCSTSGQRWPVTGLPVNTPSHPVAYVYTGSGNPPSRSSSCFLGGPPRTHSSARRGSPARCPVPGAGAARPPVQAPGEAGSGFQAGITNDLFSIKEKNTAPPLCPPGAPASPSPLLCCC